MIKYKYNTSMNRRNDLKNEKHLDEVKRFMLDKIERCLLFDCRFISFVWFIIFIHHWEMAYEKLPSKFHIGILLYYKLYTARFCVGPYKHMFLVQTWYVYIFSWMKNHEESFSVAVRNMRCVFVCIHVYEQTNREIHVRSSTEEYF